MIVKELGYQLVKDISRNVLKFREILGQYVNAVLTCHYFKSVLYNTRVKIIVPTGAEFLPSHVDSRDEAESQVIHHTFVQALQQYQIFYLRKMGPAMSTFYIKRFFGNFHLNPMFTDLDIDHLHQDDTEDWIDFLLLLGPCMRVHAHTYEGKHSEQPWTTAGKSLISSCNREPSHQKRILELITLELKSLMLPVNNADRVMWHELVDMRKHSVKGWSYIDDHRITGQSVAKEVEEWWVWPTMWLSDRLLFSGYCGDKAWVVDAHELMVYTNFEEPRSIAPNQELRAAKGIDDKMLR
jgi:hypothetical protein